MEANTSTSTAPATLPDLLRQAAKRFSKHRAILFGGRTLDYASFDGLSDRFAGALAAQGIVKGDRVGLYCVNSDAFAIAYFGILKAGATVVPINLLLNPKEIAFILSDAGAKALVYHEAFAAAVQSFKSNVQSLEFAVCIGTAKVHPDDFLWSDFIANQHPASGIQHPDDLAAIIYTSGTTGRPAIRPMAWASSAAWS